MDDSNREDARLLIGMNRFRQAYLELAPELRPYFPSMPDDITVLLPSFGANTAKRLIYFMRATPAVVATINLVLVGVIPALVADALGAPILNDVLVGVIAAVAAGLGQAVNVYRNISDFRRGLAAR